MPSNTAAKAATGKPYWVFYGVSVTCSLYLSRLQVVGYQKATINADKTFTLTGASVTQPTDASNNPMLVGQILFAPCDAGLCPVRKDTTLMPPGYATTVRIRTAGKPGLFVWHW
jgi:hypothetical protein